MNNVVSSNRITSRDRVRAALEHRQLDRIPMIETLFWPQTIERWHKEGLPEDVDISEYFGLDRFENFFSVFDCTFQITPEVIEDTDDFYVEGYNHGVIVYNFYDKSGNLLNVLKYTIDKKNSYKKLIFRKKNNEYEIVLQ